MNHRIFRAALACGIALGFAWGSHAEPIPVGSLPGISGLAKLAEGAYLAVHDEKVKDEGEDEGPRIGLVTLGGEGVAWAPVDADWGVIKGGRPHDLESICEIVGKPGEFITVESGYRDDDSARIIHLKAALVEGKAVVNVLGMVRYLPWLPDGSKFEDIEGAQTFQRGETTYLLLAKRGKNGKKARLIWGELNWNNPVFKVKEDYKVDTPFKDLDVKPDMRYASDVLISEGRIYIVSCNDPGDAGPFTSVVYHVGAVRPDGQLIHLIDSGQTEIIRYEGHKVEALAAPHGDKGLWVAATDDEDFKGSLFVTRRP